ncbi:MAG: hypothetical protein AB7R89_31230 [Dehalococcoidia bacterium]
MDINTLKQLLQEKVNLSPEQAEQAAQVALQYVAEQIPQASGLIEKAGGAEGLSKKLGGILGG